METDLSLIEISGEDDSLLSTIQHSPSTNSGNANSYFSCSPLLQIPRSTSATRFIYEDDSTSKPSCSSCDDDSNHNGTMNKENFNLDKQEAPKLSIEPQQMKRKKKGGGYNLRKSLAWDRAFFTEEGVLDPLELSMLSGNPGKHNGEMLSVIHEGRESLSGDLDNADDNLFKELPSSTPNQGRKVAATLPKLGSPARHNKTGPASAVGHSQAKRKVLAAHDINRSASKRSGCPRPVASSPSNTTTTKTKVVDKDARVSKHLAPKQDPSAVLTSSRGSITSAGHPKRNVISQPGTVQKNVVLRGTSINTKTARNDAKSGPAGKLITKSTTQPARRNVVKVSSVPEVHSSSSGQLPRVSQAKNSLEVIPDSVVPEACPASGHVNNTRDIAVSFSQTGCYNMGPTQNQIAKPSGLRMPSPSLGFFGQSKPSGSHSLLQRRSQLCNLAKSNIPNNSKAATLNPTHQRPPPSGNLPATPNMVQSMASIENAASTEKIKFNSKLNIVHKVTLQPQPNSKISDTINHNNQRHNICQYVGQQSIDYAAPCKFETSSGMESRESQSNKSKLPLQSGSCEELDTDDLRSVDDVCLKSKDSSDASLDYAHFTSTVSLPVEVDVPSESKDMIVNEQLEECNPYMKNLGACSESQFSEVDKREYEVALEVDEDQLGGVLEDRRWTSQQAELMKPDTCIVDPISNGESHRLNDTLLEEIRFSEKLSEYDSSNTADVLLEVQETTKDVTIGADYLSRGLHAVGAQMLSVEGNLLVESSKTLLSDSALDNTNLMIIDNAGAKSAEQAELPNHCAVTEQVSQDTCRPLFTGCFTHGKCSEEFQGKNNLQSVKPDELRTSDCRGGLRCSDVLCSIPPVSQTCSFNETGKVEYLHVENAPLIPLDPEPVDENFRHEANALALERMEKNHMTGAVITGNVEMYNLCPNRGDSSESMLDNPHSAFQISPILQVKVASGMTNGSESEGAIDKQYDKSFTSFSDSKPENDACCSERGTDIMPNGCSTSMHEVKEQTAEQAKLMNFCYHKAEQENQGQEVCDDLIIDKSRPFEDDSANGGNGSEIPSPHQFEIMKNELTGVGDVIKETVLEDAVEQPLDESFLADSYNSNVKSSLVVDNVSREHSELQNHGLCLNNNLLLMGTSVGLQEIGTHENVSGIVLEQFTACPSESKSTDLCSPVKDVGFNIDKNSEPLFMDLSVENITCDMNGEYRSAHELDNQTCPSNFESSPKTNGEQIPLDAKIFDPKPICSLNGKTNETSSRSTKLDLQEDLSDSDVLPAEAEINIQQNNDDSNSELKDGLESAVYCKEVEDATISLKKSVNDKKQDALVIRPPSHVVPFSDEWLAAFEAAGEEIVARKGGAVQNSPPDKPLPEPSPWSPVRRKNNQGIGPYDCTKFTNINNPSSTSD